ncbi:MAG: hypothetical protein EXS13_00765 [Planctomycetes bacterium]|nr:hypothetical protein [Planctomycetota bacterium]
MTSAATLPIALACILVIDVRGDSAPNDRGANLDAPAAREALDIAIAQAVAGAFEDAAAGFDALRGHADRAVAAAAAYDFARVQYERSLRRSFPDAPPKRPKPGAVADARARLAQVREELESARAALLEAGQHAVRVEPPDVERLASISAVVERLRDVEARDRAWAVAAEAGATARRATNGPLKPGPSGAKASSGAPGERGGAGNSEDGGERPSPASALPIPAGGGPTVATEELRERLQQARAEAAEHDERRAQAERARAGARRQ